MSLSDVVKQAGNSFFSRPILAEFGTAFKIAPNGNIHQWLITTVSEKRIGPAVFDCADILSTDWEVIK